MFDFDFNFSLLDVSGISAESIWLDILHLEVGRFDGSLFYFELQKHGWRMDILYLRQALYAWLDRED